MKFSRMSRSLSELAANVESMIDFVYANPKTAFSFFVCFLKNGPSDFVFTIWLQSQLKATQAECLDK